MPVTVHKVLINAKDIIQRVTLLVGILSEDVQETQNKNYKTCNHSHMYIILEKIVANQQIKTLFP